MTMTNKSIRDYINLIENAQREGYTGRETKDGTWRVFKDGQAVAVAGPFKSQAEAAAWIKQKTGVTENWPDRPHDWPDYDDNQYSLTDSTGKELTLLRGNTPEEAIERAKDLIGSNEKLLATFGLVKLTPKPYYIVRNGKKQGVAEGSEYKSRHIHRQEQNKKYDEYRKSQEAEGKKPLSRGDWAATQRKSQQGVAEEQLEETTPEAIAKIEQLTRQIS